LLDLLIDMWVYIVFFLSLSLSFIVFVRRGGGIYLEKTKLIICSRNAGTETNLAVHLMSASDSKGVFLSDY
jgi:hypothetical protein